uniref:ATP synthase F0 subunit 8 n=1 Tax=Aspidophiura sp. TaxID=3135528 RepID=A0AAU6QDG3_9ECHI
MPQLDFTLWLLGLTLNWTFFSLIYIYLSSSWNFQSTPAQTPFNNNYIYNTWSW